MSKRERTSLEGEEAVPLSLQYIRQILHDDPDEGKRIAEASGLGQQTFRRWGDKNTANPRAVNLRLFVAHCSEQYQSKLIRLLQEDGFITQQQKDVYSEALYTNEVPSQFMAEILRTREGASEFLQTWTICGIVLSQCLPHLDPNREGLMISLLTFLPPRSSEESVRSLCEMVSIQTFREGSPLATGQPQFSTRFLCGAESLAAQACVKTQMEMEQYTASSEIAAYLPFFPSTRSALATPLLLAGKTCGCLLFVSAQPDFFSPTRIRLIRVYASLATLAFAERKFYNRARLKFALIPLPALQPDFSSLIRRRMVSIMRQTTPDQEAAEAETWHQIEEDCIQLATTNEIGSSGAEKI